MENIGKNIEDSRKKIESAKNEILRLREISKNSIAAGKTQAEEGLLQYAKDFEAIDISLIGEREAELLDLVMNAVGQEDYKKFVALAKKYQQDKILGRPKDNLEAKSSAALFNYIANVGSMILNRAE